MGMNRTAFHVTKEAIFFHAPLFGEFIIICIQFVHQLLLGGICNIFVERVVKVFVFTCRGYLSVLRQHLVLFNYEEHQILFGSVWVGRMLFLINQFVQHFEVEFGADQAVVNEFVEFVKIQVCGK